MKLQRMSDFVIEQMLIWSQNPMFYCQGDFIRKVNNYAKFLKKTITINMFCNTCEQDILFKNVILVKPNNENEGAYSLTIGDVEIAYRFVWETTWNWCIEPMTIEDLLFCEDHIELELTENAINQFK